MLIAFGYDQGQQECAWRYTLSGIIKTDFFTRIQLKSAQSVLTASPISQSLLTT